MIISLDHFSVYFYCMPSSPRGTMILWPSVLLLVGFSVQQALCVCHGYQSCVYFAMKLISLFFMGLEFVYWISVLDFFFFWETNFFRRECHCSMHQPNVLLFLLVSICGSKSPILILSCSFDYPTSMKLVVFLKQSNIFF